MVEPPTRASNLKSVQKPAENGSVIIVVDYCGTMITVGPKGLATLFALAPVFIAFGIYLGAVAGAKLMPSPAK